MLGLFGKKEEILTAKQTEAKLFDLLKSAAEEVWLISPYCEMDKLSYLRRQIDATLDQVNVTFVVRDEPKQTDPAERALADLMAKGLTLGAVNRLHAKIYWSDQHAILTSANLLDGSFDKSLEVGLWVPAGHIHDKLREFIRAQIEPEMREIGPKRQKPRPKKKRAQTASGHCIRCGEMIPRNTQRPLCLSDYAKWANFENLDYSEKFCHGCGKEARTSMRRPLCGACFKAQAA